MTEAREKCKIAGTEKARAGREIAKAIADDLEKRRRARRKIELQWLLNINFYTGNQYCKITRASEIGETDKNYAWESREVFNHIAPIMETRLAKLARLSPTMTVRPSGSDEADLETAKLSGKILNGVMGDLEYASVLAAGCRWSEVCGTAFYKVLWDNGKGQAVAREGDRKILSGDVNIVAVSPFEIYPENLAVENLARQKSILHAKALSTREIYDIWGVRVPGREVLVQTLEQSTGGGGEGESVLKDAEIVIERYALPTPEKPNGSLQIAAGEELLYDGELPYLNGKEGGRTYPFIKQISLEYPSRFFGSSVIERLIPVQRAYNAVKNRKYEYLSRISMGVLRVEDGSVDTDLLQEEGLTPGSVLVYRQGANPPAVMENFSLPADFSREEDRLLNEFVLISGVSELMRSSRYYTENTSGVALQILSDLEDTKLLVTIDSLKRAVRDAAKQTLRLYKQFAVTKKLVRISGERGGVEVLHFNRSDIAGDDVIFETESDFMQSPLEKRGFALELLKSGLLTDENGKTDKRMRAKLLEILGFGGWEAAQEVSAAHLTKAAFENEHTDKLMPLGVDDHELHILEHTKRAVLWQVSGGKQAEIAKLLAHIEEHRSFLGNAAENVLRETAANG